MPTTEHRTLQIVRDALAEPPAATGMDAIRRAVRGERGLPDLARQLVNRAGGLDQLEHLDADPLPDEPFRWSAVDDADRSVVEAVLALVEHACDGWLDVEYRTIAYRLLALVAAHDPGPLRRTKRPERLAAGLLLAVLEGNGAAGRGARWPTGAVGAWFGTSSPREIARTIVRSAGLSAPYDVSDAWTFWPPAIELPSVELLHSSARRRLITDRDTAIAAIEDQERRRAGRRAMVALGDGKVQVRCWPADLAMVHVGRSPAGEEMVVVGLSPVQPAPELELVGLSIPEAHRLLEQLEVVLRAPVSITPLPRRR